MEDTYTRLIALLNQHGAQYRLIDHAPEGRTELVSAMRALRPEQFEAEHDQAGDAAAPERPHSSEVAATSTCS